MRQFHLNNKNFVSRFNFNTKCFIVITYSSLVTHHLEISEPSVFSKVTLLLQLTLNHAAPSQPEWSISPSLWMYLSSVALNKYWLQLRMNFAKKWRLIAGEFCGVTSNIYWVLHPKNDTLEQENKRKLGDRFQVWSLLNPGPTRPIYARPIFAQLFFKLISMQVWLKGLRFRIRLPQKWSMNVKRPKNNCTRFFVQKWAVSPHAGRPALGGSFPCAHATFTSCHVWQRKCWQTPNSNISNCEHHPPNMWSKGLKLAKRHFSELAQWNGNDSILTKLPDP